MGLQRVDPFRKKMNRAMRLALNSLGRDLVAAIREALNVKVEYIGSEIIRSDPGEEPRKEFGLLSKSIKYRVMPKAQGVDALIVFTDYQIAVYLEYGTMRIEPRPFFFKTVRKAGSLKNEFKRRLKYFLTIADANDPDVLDPVVPLGSDFGLVGLS